MVKVLVKKLNPKVQLPSYKTEGSSGMDLMAFVENSIKIAPNSSALILILSLKQVPKYHPKKSFLSSTLQKII